MPDTTVYFNEEAAWWVDDEEQASTNLDDVKWGWTSYSPYRGKAVVTRLSFKVPNTGAGHYVIHLNRIGRIDKYNSLSTKKLLGYHIGRSKTECIGWYGPDHESDGTITISATSDYNVFTIEGDYMMRPGETLYLWLFHCGETRNSQAHYRIRSTTQANLYIELSGEGGGVTHINIDGDDTIAVPYIWHSGAWVPAVPHAYHNGEYVATC